MSCLSHVSLPVKEMLALPSQADIAAKIAENEQLRSAQLGLSADLVSKQYKPVIVVGPSGVGKSTLINVLTDKYPTSFGFSVSFTTRQPRQGEEHGKNYFFIDKTQFESMIEQDDFIEWCNVHGNMYGTAKSQIRAIQGQSQIPLLDIDIQGTEKFLKAFPETNTLFMFPPSIADLETRLTNRGTESADTLKTRLKNASSEIERGLMEQDPTCLIGYRLVNKDLARSTPAFVAIFEALYGSELV